MNDEATTSIESPAPSYLNRPRLRPVEAFPVELEGRELIALRDVSNLSSETTVVTKSALFVMEQFTGQNTIAEIAAQLETDPEPINALAAHLDRGLFLYGDRFDEARQEVLREFDALEILPIRASVEFTDENITNALTLAEQSDAFQSWVSNEPKQITGLVAPHLDLQRGNTNYALSYAALRHWLTADPAHGFDRVIVFGTNHFGAGTGVIMNAKDQETPLGTVPTDQALADRLHAALGSKLINQRLDHLREHSVELQIPWISKTLGPIPTLGFLIHDPTANECASYDGNGIGLDEFIKQLKASLDKLGGRTLFIASADLSHVGPEFSDETPNTPEILNEVEQHDCQHLAYLVNGDLEAFTASIQEKQNATRWCTLGGMTALWEILPSETCPQLLNYHQATKHPEYDDLTRCCVTSASMILSHA